MSLRPLLRNVVLAALLAGAGLRIAAEGWQLERILSAVRTLYGENGAQAAQEWSRVMTVLRGGNETQKLKDINDYFNRKLRFSDDQTVWGKADYWATPLESLMKGAGDCEDFAIAKYFSLKYLGVPVSKLRLAYVEARIGGPNSPLTQGHVVLTYYPERDAEPLILDNLLTEIRPASRRPDLLPVFSFNSEGVFAPGGGPPQSGGSRLSRWNDLIEKMKAEGFE